MTPATLTDLLALEPHLRARARETAAEATWAAHEYLRVLARNGPDAFEVVGMAEAAAEVAREDADRAAAELGRCIDEIARLRREARTAYLAACEGVPALPLPGTRDAAERGERRSA